MEDIFGLIDTQDDSSVDYPEEKFVIFEELEELENDGVPETDEDDDKTDTSSAAGEFVLIDSTPDTTSNADTEPLSSDEVSDDDVADFAGTDGDIPDEETVLEDNIIECPTLCNVKQGNVCIVQDVGGEPVVIGVIGGGDIMADDIAEAWRIAQEAYQQSVAAAEQLIKTTEKAEQAAQDAATAKEAMGNITQYTWNDAEGTHVSTVENSTENAANILINAAGVDINTKGTDKPVASFTKDGVILREVQEKVVDGSGETELVNTPIASFTKNGMIVGSSDDAIGALTKDGLLVGSGANKKLAATAEGVVIYDSNGNAASTFNDNGVQLAIAGQPIANFGPSSIVLGGSNTTSITMAGTACLNVGELNIGEFGNTIHSKEDLIPVISDSGKWIINGEETEYSAQGDDGHSPYIGLDGYWWEWDASAGKYHATTVEAKGPKGDTGPTPQISTDGYWILDGVKTEYSTSGDDGHSPYVNKNTGYWMEWDPTQGKFIQTTIKAQGPKGEDGITPTISNNGNWIINGKETTFTAIGDDGHSPRIQDGYWWEWNDSTGTYQNTNIKAEGVDGDTPEISANGNWIINGKETEYSSKGDDGRSPYIENGYWWEWNDESKSFQFTGIKAQGTDGRDGVDGIDVTSQYVYRHPTYGLCVVPAPSDTSGPHARITTDGFAVMNGTTALGSFTSNNITFGDTSGYNTRITGSGYSLYEGSDLYLTIKRWDSGNAGRIQSKTSGSYSSAALFYPEEIKLATYSGTSSRSYAQLTSVRLNVNKLWSEDYVTAQGNVSAHNAGGSNKISLANATGTAHAGWHGLYSDARSGWIIAKGTSGNTLYSSQGSTDYTITKSSTSSRLVKENIEPMPDSIGTDLLNVEMVTFDYKEGYEDGAKGQLGVIAEDTWAIAPEAIVNTRNIDIDKEIAENGDTSTLGVDYTKFIPRIIKLCQVQQKQIDELKSKNEELENRLAALEAKLGGTE